VAAKESEATLVSVLEAAAAAGRAALARTPELLPVLADAGVVDAGGAGFLLLIDALLHVADGRPLPQPEPGDGTRAPARPAEIGDHEAGSDLRYEVMFLLEAADESIELFKAAWAKVGDSIVVVGGDGLWSCHIHTDDIGAALEAGVDAGRPTRIRVTDLAEQIAHERCGREGDAAAATDGAAAATAVVAVGAGEGAVEILRSLGVARVVTGGQSMNPSTAELLDAIAAAGGREVVVLPNNHNVVPVAERAAGLAHKPVRVVPTASLAEGFAALMGFDADVDANANAAAMEEAAAHVAWGQVTWAVRDAKTAAGPVRQGDHLGLLGHEIVARDADLADAACHLLDRLVTADHELVTVVEGEAATADATRRIKAWLGENRPRASVEVHRGDQPLSAYLFSAE
jgi:DAK2 domain fusion protein YloV